MITNVRQKEARSIPLLPYAWGAIILWFVLLALSFLWNVKTENSGILEAARIEARTAFKKDVIYRRWNAEHGGIYAPVTEQTPPNPYLDVAERDIRTPSGKKLTMINPSYMTRQAHELTMKAYGMKSHITSLNPIRPENAADPWEARALKAFEKGLKEVSSVEKMEDDKYMRLMHPLITEKGCLKCHAKQGYKLGDIRGGISVSIPMAPFMAISKHKFFTLSVGHGLLLLFGLILIGLGMRHFKQQIHKRMGLEEALQESELFLSNVFDSIQDGISVLDTDLNIVSVNQTMRKRHAHMLPLEGKKCYEAYHWRNDKCEICPTIRALETGKLEMDEVPLTQEDVTTGTIELFAFPILDESGKPKGVVEYVRDVTVRKEVEKALQESEERFRELAELLPETIYEMDINGNLTFVNRSAFDHFRYDQKDYDQGLNAFEMIAPEDRNKAMENIRKILGGEDVPLKEYTALRKDGSTFPALFHSTAIFRDQKQVGLRGFIIDITEKKRLESQVQQSQKMEAMGTLAGGIAHDFNNILSSVIGYTELALLDSSKGTQQNNNLKSVLIAGNRAKDLVKQILTFSRQADQEQKPVQLKLVVKEALKLLRASIPSTIEIEQIVESDSLVLGDPTQIHQVFMNLCTNATHAMRDKGGVLSVSLADENLDSESISNHPVLKLGAYINLTVADTGHGITPDDLKKIFDPFFTTKEKGEGTGMGLSVVHGIVQSHGGAIYVHSEPGKGSTFKVFLPVIERFLKAEDIVESPLHTGTERILFIDDEPAIVDMGKQILESLGYDVVTRTSSIEALELFRAQKSSYDLVITDMTMPHMTGIDLAKELLSIRSDIPIILCTGFSEQIDENKAKEIGLRAFVMKPILRREIANTIRKVLDEK